MYDFLIFEDDWLYGEGSTYSYLYRPEDKKECCLGQLAVGCGFTLAQLREERSIADLSKHTGVQVPPQLAFLLTDDGKNSAVACDLMEINDERLGGALFEGEDRVAVLRTQEQRKRLLAEKFAEADIAVTYIAGHRPR